MDTSFTSLKIRTDATPEQLLKELAMSPMIYLRLVGILFSIIVFGCMADKGFWNAPTNRCVLNDSGACNFAIAIGVLAFVICLAFLVKDVIMVVVDFSPSIIFKKIIIVTDMTVTGLWTFFWFVSFCFSTDQLRKVHLRGSTRSCMNSTIAFSFFSIILWIAIIALNGLFLFWIFKGTDKDCRPSNYNQFPGGDADDGDYDDKVDETPPETSKPQYSPPEY